MTIHVRKPLKYIRPKIVMFWTWIREPSADLHRSQIGEIEEKNDMPFRFGMVQYASP